MDGTIRAIEGKRQEITLSTGDLPPDKWHHLFIAEADGKVRPIGMFRTDASGHVMPFRSEGDIFTFHGPVTALLAPEKQA